MGFFQLNFLSSFFFRFSGFAPLVCIDLFNLRGLGAGSHFWVLGVAAGGKLRIEWNRKILYSSPSGGNSKEVCKTKTQFWVVMFLED